MNGHRIAIVVLHTLAGLFVFGCVATLWIAAALLAPTFDGSFIPELVALFGKPVAVLLLTLAFVEIVAALFLIRHPNRAARFALMAISALQLFVFPIGTALAIYTFVFLNRVDAARPDPVAP